MAKQEVKETRLDLKYKLRLVVDIEGETDMDVPLMEDSSIYCYLQWFIDDIQCKLDALCDVKKVLKIELEESVDGNE